MNERENPLSLSWCDKQFIPQLNTTNVMNYFSERSNPFYDHTCNNEMLRMRGLRMDSMLELEKMQGIEYVLLHVQEPILYVVRKQKRHSPIMTTALTNYYIIAGIVYQAPDLQSIIQSKMLTAIYHLQTAFDDCFQFARFHPSNEYYWNFCKDGQMTLSSGLANSDPDKASRKDAKLAHKEEPSSKKDSVSVTDANDAARHMYRVDMLMHELVKKFPPKLTATSTTGSCNLLGGNDTLASASSAGGENAENSNPNIKNELLSSSSDSIACEPMDSNTSLSTMHEGKSSASLLHLPPSTKKAKLN